MEKRELGTVVAEFIPSMEKRIRAIARGHLSSWKMTISCLCTAVLRVRDVRTGESLISVQSSRQTAEEVLAGSGRF